MKQTTLLILATTLMLIAATSCTRAEKHPTAVYSLAELQDDFDQYVSLIHRNHPKVFTDRTALERTIAERRDLLVEGMTQMDLYRVLAPVGSKVQCGHMRTYLSEKVRDHLLENGDCLPVELRILDGRLWVYKDLTPDETVTRGSEVLAIDDHASLEIIARLRESLPSDAGNVTYKDYWANLRFARLYTVLFRPGPQIELTIQPPGATDPTTVTVAAMPPNQSKQIDEQRHGLEPEPDRIGTTFADDDSYAVLSPRDFGYYEDPDEFRIPVGKFFAELTNREIPALFLDVRGNDGGEPHCSAWIVSHVVPVPVQYFATGTPYYDDLVRPTPVPPIVFKGDLYVLTDGWCFSSTGHLLSLLRCHERGLFIGEESGGSTACNDASQWHDLDHTRLGVNVPRATFATSATCLPRGGGIPPDIHVAPTIDDLIAGRDPVLEKAISLIEAQ